MHAHHTHHTNQRGRAGRGIGPDGASDERRFGENPTSGPRERGGPRRGGDHGERGERGERRGYRQRGPHRGRPGGGPEGFFGGAFGGPGGFGPFGDPGGSLRRARRGPGRGQRGDVRNAVLALLAEEPMNGYQLIAAIAERTDGLWRPSAGSVYPALGLLEDEGLIRPTQKDGKKVFELTEAGLAYSDEHAEELTDPWDRVAGPHERYLDVRQETGALMMAVQQVVHAGDTAQITAAKAILADAKRSLYRILAGEDTPVE